MTAEVMALGAEPAARPELACVAPHMFKTYDDEGAVYCTACHRVMAGARAQLARHYRRCERPRPPAPAAARTYECGACDATMDDGGQWTRHFGTRGHWLRYNAAVLRSAHFQPAHVHECEHCGATFYRTEEYIRRHMFAMHDAGYRIDNWKRIMSAVYRARSSYYTGGMHCCAACGEVRAERHVHDPLRPACGSDDNGYDDNGYDDDDDEDDDNGYSDDDDDQNGYGGSSQHLETFFCDTCRLTFVGREDTYLLHVASPEHVALAENLPLWRAGGGGADVDLRDWTVPAIVWRHFGGCPRTTRERRDDYDDDDDDGGPRACGLCGDLVSAADETSVLEHLDECGALLAAAAEQLLPTPPSGKSAADYDAFRCGVCRGSRDRDDDDDGCGTMADFRSWSRHVTAGRHLMTPRAMAAYAYSDCAGCRTLYFGPAELADDGSPCATGGPHRFRPLPVADLMRYVYRETNADADRDGPPSSQLDDDALPSAARPPPHFYYEQATGQYGRCERSAVPGAVPFYCVTCRLEFYGNRAAFRQHALTAEHMLLRQYAPFELQAAVNRPAVNRFAVTAAGRVAAAAAATDADTVTLRTADADTVTLRTADADTTTLLHGSCGGWQVDAALDAVADPKTRAVVRAAVGLILGVARVQPLPPPPPPATASERSRRY